MAIDIQKIVFENRLLQSEGSNFEDLFYKVLQKIFPSIQKTKPQGNLGDSGIDMLDIKNETVFQCYAPENITKNKNRLNSKIKKDLEKAKKYFKQEKMLLKKYIFVVNDKNKGLYLKSIVEIKNLREENSSIKIELWGYYEIVQQFENFNLNEKESIIGLINIESPIATLDFSELNKVIKHILKNSIERQYETDYKLKEFEEKIKINGLSKKVKNILLEASRQRQVIKQFFQSDRGDIIRVKNTFVLYYSESKKMISDDSNDYSDKRFFYMCGKANPNIDSIKKAIQDAIFSLMAYFFEACDIFEKESKN